jgi:hypothetical protein
MIEKWYAALDGSRHGHLILFHQEFYQIHIHVGIKHPVQKFLRVRALK